MRLAVFRNKEDIKFTIRLELDNGTCSVDSITVACGEKYKFPSVSKSGYVPEGWYTDSAFTNKITEASKVDYNIRTIYVKWVEMTNYTSFEVTTTSSYKTFGFYTATKKSDSEKIFIDWGDGTVEAVDAIAQKYHDYATVGTFTVKVSDDVTSLTVSINSSTYYNKVRYTLKKILTYSTSITTIPTYCYYYCSALTNISADFSNISSLNAYAFYYCNTLTNFDFMKKMTKITSIPNYCFQNCTYFTDLSVIPTSVTSFGSYAFYQCRITDLSRIRSTDTLNSYCFAYNTTLTSLATLKTRTSFPSYLFNYCSGLKEANLTAFTSLTSLNSGCFSYCSQLTSVQLPSSIKMVSDYAFRNCSQLKNTDFISDKNQITSLGQYTFADCTSLSSINLPASVKSIGSYAFYQDYAAGLKDLNLCGLTSLATINAYAFQYCYNLTAMTLPSSLTSIGDYTFAGCYNMNQISAYRDTAPTVWANTFGSSTSNGTTAYTGNNKRSAGTSKLYVNTPSNYKTSYWQSVLLDSSKSNFNCISFNPYSASGFEITGFDSQYVYTGSEIRPDITVKNSNGETLTENTDYTVTYSNNIECGKATITVTGAGLYVDSQAVQFTIYDPSRMSMTVDLNSQWQTPTMWTNTDANFDVYESNSNYNVNNGYAKMFITVNGYAELILYINSYAESNYDYTLAFTPDYEPTSNPSGSSATGNVAGTTYGFQFNPSSYGITSGSGWKKVTYTLDGGEHRICICYRKDSSEHSNWDRGYVAIPKLQA